MPSIIDKINEHRKINGYAPVEIPNEIYNNNDGYTNENDLGTLTGAFAIGAGNMLNNTLVGGTGYGLANLGRLVEFISPFSGEGISDNDRLAMYRLGYDDDFINREFPRQDSWVTSGAKGVLSAQNAIDDSLSEARQDLLGDNPTMAARISEGGGSSIGYTLAGLALGGNPLMKAIISGVGEALSEAGGQLGDAYREGMYDKGAIGAINKGFLANAALNTGLEYLAGPFGKIPGKIENPVGRYAAGTVGEIINEILQEPSQNVIEEAVKNSMNNGTGFLSELGESAKKWPETFAQLAPEVAGSTLLTQGLLAPLHIRANINNNNSLNQPNPDTDIQTDAKGNGVTELDKLKQDRLELQTLLNNAKTSKEQDEIMVRLENVNNAIKNLGKDAETVTAEGRAEMLAAMPYRDENNPNLIVDENGDIVENAPVAPVETLAPETPVSAVNHFENAAPQNPVDNVNPETVTPVAPVNDEGLGLDGGKVNTAATPENIRTDTAHKKGRSENEIALDIAEKIRTGTKRPKSESEALAKFYVNANKYLGQYTGNSLEEMIDSERTELKRLARHRLEQGKNVKAELLYIDIVRKIEKMGDNCFSIAGIITRKKAGLQRK